MSRVSWDERNRSEGTNGEFLVYLNKRYAQPVLKVEAEGYKPKRFPLQPESRTNLVLQLEKGSGPSGTVLLPDGKPAQGVSLALLCEGEQEVSLDSSGALRAWRHRELIDMTEPDGSFTLKPQLDMAAVVVASKEGFKITPVNDLTANSKIVLEAWGKVKGVLQRASRPSTNEPIDLALDGHPLLSLQLHTVTDSEGRFEFEHVPPGRLQINGRNMVSANGWTWDPLEKVDVKAGSEVTVDIKAPAKSQERPNFAHGAPVARPKRLPGPGLQGAVLLPNGQPAADAEVALLAPATFISLGKATFKAYEARQEGLIARTDLHGHFALPLVEGAREIVAVHEQGFAEIELGTFRSISPIKLEPWGRIEGTLRVGQRL
ncbi:MAG: carboxypeptidase-like regulatory domain-containing protein [Bryobacteraceae bacterium]